MNTFNKIIGVIITIFISFIVFFMGVKVKSEGVPLNLFAVYLNGEKIGLIESKDDLLKLIDNEQTEIKNKYNVDKVYPPSGLDIQSIVTYDNDIISVNSVYEKIKDIEPFTISGYHVTINYDYLLEESSKEDGKKDTTIEAKEPIVLNVLNKEDFEEGLYNTAAAFIGRDSLQRYNTDTQLEIVDVGMTIENVYWQEDISIKKAFLSTEEYIYTNSSDISKYLLFGTLEEGKKYVVRDGDNIASVANANNLNVDEFLVANPNFISSNVLLTAGQVVNTALIAPAVNIVYEVEKVEDVEVPFETEYREDDSMYIGQTEVIQSGENGKARITESIQYINGEIKGLIITGTSELAPAVNKVVSKGTKEYEYIGPIIPSIDFSNEDWVWPTVSPFVITSYYGWRWGKLHGGIDVSGTGFGSPLFSSTDGIVLRIYNSCANRGYYGSPCGGGYGNYVYVQTDSGYTIYYAHTTNDIPVSVGQRVSKGQIIAYMGDSGSSTGTHLHYQIEDAFGNRLDPCQVAFKC